MADALGYRIDITPPSDKQVERDRLARLLSISITVAVLIFGPIYLGTYIGSWMGSGMTKFGFLVGLAVGIGFVASTAHRMFIYNREWSAYVTNNALSGKNVPYGPGLHLSHWWEERNKAGNYPLTVINVDFTVTVPTKTAAVKVEGVLQWMIDLRRITNFIGVDETTIKDGFIAFIQSFLTARFADITAEEARAQTAQTNTAMCNEFMGTTHAEGATPTPTTTPVEFEQQYGITTVTVALKSIQLPPAVQAMRDAIDEATEAFHVAAQLNGMSVEEYAKAVKDGTVTKDDFHRSLQEALTLSGSAKMQIIQGNLEGIGGQVVNKFLGGGQS